jgi:diphthine synthase
MLTFVGLGLYDERSITLEGRDAVRGSDRVFAEFYTSRLMGTTVDALESFHDVSIEVRDRSGVERDPEPILAAAESGDAVFLTAGDPMISTTHVDLRMRAADRGVETRVVHGTTAEAAAASLTGLQNYRFGKATTLPFPYAHGGEGVPESVVGTIEANRERGLHTLVYLDIKVDHDPGDRAAKREPNGEGNDGSFMRGDEAAALLADHWDADALAAAVCRAGSADPLVAADRLDALAGRDLGEPLHLLVVPGDLHLLEAEALEALAGAPADAVEERTV